MSAIESTHGIYHMRMSLLSSLHPAKASHAYMYGVVLTISQLHGDDVLGAWFVSVDETPGPRGTVGSALLLPAQLPPARTINFRIRSMLRDEVAWAAFSFLGSHATIAR